MMTTRSRVYYSAGELTAWRCFKYKVTVDREVRYFSTTFANFEWFPGQVMKSDFERGDECKGFYSFKTHQLAIDAFSVFDQKCLFLLGKIEIWGDIDEHVDGYRSQFARILFVEAPPWLDPDACRWMRVQVFTPNNDLLINEVGLATHVSWPTEVFAYLDKISWCNDLFRTVQTSRVRLTDLDTKIYTEVPLPRTVPPGDLLSFASRSLCWTISGNIHFPVRNRRNEHRWRELAQKLQSTQKGTR